MKKCTSRQPRRKMQMGGFSWGNSASQISNAMGLTQGIGGIAQSLGNAYGSRHAADTSQRAVGNALSGTAQGAMAGAAFGPIGMGVGAAAGLVGGLIKSNQEKKAYQEELKEKQKGFTLTEDLKNSYNPMTMQKGGNISPYQAERNYVKRIAKNPVGLGQSSKQSVNSPGIYKAGTNEYTPFMNKREKGGSIRKPRRIMQAGGDMPYEIEDGEAVLGNPNSAQLYGGADSSNESELGFIANGAKHGETNDYGSEGIPMDADEEMYVGSDAIGLDGRPASKSNPSVAQEMKPYLKYGENATKSGDRYDKAGMEAAEDELAHLQQEAEEGKFLEELYKMTKAKDRDYEEIMQFIIDANPNDAAAIQGDTTQPEQAVAEMEGNADMMAQQEMAAMNQQDPNAMAQQGVDESMLPQEDPMAAMQGGMPPMDPNMMAQQGGGMPPMEDPAAMQGAMPPMAKHGLVTQPKVYRIGGKIYRKEGGPVGPPPTDYNKTNYSSDKTGYYKNEQTVTPVQNAMYDDNTPASNNEELEGVLPDNTFDEFEFTPETEDTRVAEQQALRTKQESEAREIQDRYNNMRGTLDTKHKNRQSATLTTPDGRTATRDVDYQNMTEEELLSYNPNKKYNKVGDYDQLYDKTSTNRTTLTGEEREARIAQKKAELNPKSQTIGTASSTSTRKQGTVEIDGKQYEGFLGVGKKRGLLKEDNTPSEQYVASVHSKLEQVGLTPDALSQIDMIKDIQPARLAELKETDPERYKIASLVKQSADDILTASNSKQRGELAYKTGTFINESQSKKEPTKITPEVDIYDIYGSSITKEEAIAYGKQNGWDKVTYQGKQIPVNTPAPKPASSSQRPSYRNQTQQVPNRPTYTPAQKPTYSKQGVKRKETTKTPADIGAKMRTLNQQQNNTNKKNDIIINP